MKNVSTCILEYLEAKRHIWNAYFFSRFRSIKDCSPLDEYEEIDRQLFRALVLPELGEDPLPKDGFVLNQNVIDSIKVVLRNYITNIRVLVSNPKEDKVKWTFINLVASNDITFKYIEFFEWNRYGFVSYPYVRVKIETNGSAGEVNGYEALLDLKDVEFFN